MSEAERRCANCEFWLRPKWAPGLQNYEGLCEMTPKKAADGTVSFDVTLDINQCELYRLRGESPLPGDGND